MRMLLVNFLLLPTQAIVFRKNTLSGDFQKTGAKVGGKKIPSK